MDRGATVWAWRDDGRASAIGSRRQGRLGTASGHQLRITRCGAARGSGAAAVANLRGKLFYDPAEFAHGFRIATPSCVGRAVAGGVLG